MDLSGSQIPSFSVLATNRTSIFFFFFFYQYDESFTRLITNQATLCSSRAVHTKMLWHMTYCLQTVRSRYTREHITNCDCLQVEVCVCVWRGGRAVSLTHHCQLHIAEALLLITHDLTCQLMCTVHAAAKNMHMASLCFSSMHLRLAVLCLRWYNSALGDSCNKIS